MGPWDPATKTARLSRIFDWYSKDFQGKPLAFINKHRPADKQIPEDARIELIDYDWRLNDQSLQRGPHAH